jgi:hypothetical protein
MQIMEIHLLPLIALAGLFLSAFPAAARINVVNTGFLNNTANLTSYTLSFNAGNGGTADKLGESFTQQRKPTLEATNPLSPI